MTHRGALGLTITHRIETEGFTEIVLSGEDGNRIQLASHHDQTGPIEHGNGFWKLYLKTDDCAGLYQRCMDARAESISAPERLEHWPVTAAFVLDPERLHGGDSRAPWRSTGIEWACGGEVSLNFPAK